MELSGLCYSCLSLTGCLGVAKGVIKVQGWCGEGKCSMLLTLQGSRTWSAEGSIGLEGPLNGVKVRPEKHRHDYGGDCRLWLGPGGQN